MRCPNTRSCLEWFQSFTILMESRIDSIEISNHRFFSDCVFQQKGLKVATCCDNLGGITFRQWFNLHKPPKTPTLQMVCDQRVCVCVCVWVCLGVSKMQVGTSSSSCAYEHASPLSQPQSLCFGAVFTQQLILFWLACTTQQKN